MSVRRQCVVVSIILLLIGVIVAPPINYGVVKASTDNDLVEVTSQACGIQGYGNTIVKLTREQNKELEQYLVEFQARLNQTTTREEAVPIFKEAVVELNKYGLLPKGMSVKRAQLLVTVSYQNIKIANYFKKPSTNSINSWAYVDNSFCLLYGNTRRNTMFQGPISRVISIVLFMLANGNNHFVKLFLTILILYNLLHLMSSYLVFHIFKVVPYLGNTIYYGMQEQAPGANPQFLPAQGEIWTMGLAGKINGSGQFYGRLPFPEFSMFVLSFYPGVNGFTGLRLLFNSSDFYFGSALFVSLGPSHP